MTLSNRLLGLHFSFAFALWAAACQPDSSALFEDTALGESGRASTAGGTEGTADGGDPSGAGNDSGGRGGTTSGSPDTPSGGSGGAGMAGSALAGEAGMSGNETAGSAGMAEPDPDPVTVEIRAIDDAGIASCRPMENYGADPKLTVDASGSGIGKCVYQALFGFALGVVPSGSRIDGAELTLHCVNAGAAVDFFYVEEPWQQGTVRWFQRPKQGERLGGFTCTASESVTLDLTSAVAAWQTGAHAAHGIYLATEGTNGTDFATSEAKNEAERPVLRVTYRP